MILSILIKQDRTRLINRLSRNIKHYDNGCVIWKSTIDRYGYGKINFKVGGVVKQLKIHRVFSVLSTGKDIPVDMSIDHKCCNELCCNPAHMVLETNSDNVRLMHKRKKER